MFLTISILNKSIVTSFKTSTLYSWRGDSIQWSNNTCMYKVFLASVTMVDSLNKTCTRRIEVKNYSSSCRRLYFEICWTKIELSTVKKCIRFLFFFFLSFCFFFLVKNKTPAYSVYPDPRLHYNGFTRYRTTVNERFRPIRRSGNIE